MKRAVALSYHNAVYLKREQLLDLQIAHNYTCWPRTVLVMDDTFELLGDTYSDPATGDPATLDAWVEYHFRPLRAPLDHLQCAIRIWWGIHDKVITYLIEKERWKPHVLHPLAFNTTWALLGYEHNQEEAALDLAAEIFTSPSFQKLGRKLRYPDLTKEQANAQEEAYIPGFIPEEAREKDRSRQASSRQREDGGNAGTSRNRSVNWNGRGRPRIFKRPPERMASEG